MNMINMFDRYIIQFIRCSLSKELDKAHKEIELNAIYFRSYEIW